MNNRLINYRTLLKKKQKQKTKRITIKQPWLSSIRLGAYIRKVRVF